MNPLRSRVRRSGPLRVLFVVPDLGVGGAERHVATLAPALDPRRFAASVVCIGEGGALFQGLVDAGVPAVALDERRNPAAALAGLVALMRRGRPDVVVTRGYNAEALGRAAAVLTRVPRLVVWVHNCGDVTPRGLLRGLVDRLLDPATSAYYGVAEGQRAYLRDELGYRDAKIEIIHNGVDPDRIPPRPATRDAALAAELGLPPNAPVIGIVAVLRPEKDHATLLRAVRLVVDELPAARLLVVGDGEERARLEALTAELGLTGSVVFAGVRSDVPAVLGLLDVVALSSYTVEAFPMALLEAMSAGLPAVGTAVGGVPEMVEDGVTGYVVPARDPQALAAALVKLLVDPQRAVAMGRAGRARVRELFTLDRSVRVVGETLERTAGRRERLHPVRLTLVCDLTFVGGAEKLLLQVLARVDRRRVLPRILCLREEGPLAAEFRAAGVPVEVLERRDGRDLARVGRLARWLRTSGTDVVLVNHHHRAALTLGRVAARLAGVPSVVAAHGMGTDVIGERVLPRHDVETLALSAALVLLTPGQGRYLREREGVGTRPWRRTREVVIPNGVVVGPAPGPAERAGARARLGLRPDDIVLGVVARLSPEKSHATLLRAVAALAPTRPGLHLVVVGDGAERAALGALVADLGIADRVLFTGTRHDVPDLLPGFDVSCLTSLHEALPMVVLEAMAAGLPVVVTAVGALPELVREDEDGFLVPAGDVEALTDRLARLVDQPRLRAAMGARARRRAEREFALDRTVQGYQRLFEELARS